MVFFFSFFGRMVSELGFCRILPFAGPPTATCGTTELTTSVSTVMFLVDPSPETFALLAPPVVPNGFTAGALGRNPVTGLAEVVLILISPFPPLSLPLSLAVLFAFCLLDLLVPSFSPCFPGFSDDSSSDLACMISSTVSSVELTPLAPLAPLAGVRMPGTVKESSTSVSFVAGFPSDWSVGWTAR